MVVKMNTAQRRARLAKRHLLTGAHQIAAVSEVADCLVAFHATDPASVYLSAFARLPNFAATELEAALYQERSLIRMLGMRRTMFVFSRELVPVVQKACTDEIAEKQRKLLIQHLSQQGYPHNVPEAENWLASVCDKTAAAVVKRGR